ncbi:MAG: hypothetical protein U1E76_24835 [Planctomycetota bacterium]
MRHLLPLMFLALGPAARAQGTFDDVQQDVLVAVFLDTNTGAIPPSDLAAIGEAVGRTREFLARNSALRLDSRASLFAYPSHAPIVDPATGNIDPRDVEPYLIGAGYVGDQFDAVIVIAPACAVRSYGVFQILGSAAYGHLPWAGAPATDLYLLDVHGELFDAEFDAAGWPDYPSNHPGRNRDLIGVCGAGFDLAASILRGWSHWLELALDPDSHWGRLATTADADGDLFPDDEAQLAFDERRFQSSAAAPDSDGDGRADIDELLAAEHAASDPNAIDTDGESAPDGHDAFPLYPIVIGVPWRDLSIDSPLGERTLQGEYFHGDPSRWVRFYLDWDDAALHIALQASFPVQQLVLFTDNGNDGLYHGIDNYRLTLGTTVPVLERQEMYDCVNAPYPADYVVYDLAEPIRARFDDALGQPTFFLEIPKNPGYGLTLASCGSIGLWPSCDDSQVFEPNVYFRCQLTQPAAAANYGSGWPGTLGVPGFTTDHAPVLCRPITYLIDNSRGAVTGAALFAGFAPASLPTQLGGTLLLLPYVVFPLTLAPGLNSIHGRTPCDPTLCDVPFYLQVLEVDPGASVGVSFTPGLELRFGG